MCARLPQEGLGCAYVLGRATEDGANLDGLDDLGFAGTAYREAIGSVAEVMIRVIKRVDVKMDQLCVTTRTEGVRL
jgi:hypothetical protein